MAQQAVSFATLSMALAPRYEHLLELEQGDDARCHLAIDHGDAARAAGAEALGVEALGVEALGEAGPASTARPVQARHGSGSAGEGAPHARRLVTVHRAPREVAEDDERRARFAARAAAFLPLRHPNLIHVFEAVSERRGCHWVSEFVAGEPLSRLLRRTKRGRRALSTRQILSILCDAAHALEYAHGAVDAAGLPRPVVHGSLCPGSVLVTYEGMVKVSSDLCGGLPVGSAGALEALAGRLAYLAPECCAGASGDPRCDVYALGAILWEALAGRPRNVDLTPEQTLALRTSGGEPALEDVCPDVLPALAAVTGRALSTDPGDRHQSVAALREELEAIAQLDVLKNETGPLFGFMCNHFYEEYSALQALLEQHSMLHAAFSNGLALTTGSRPRPAAGGRAPSSKTGPYTIPPSAAHAASRGAAQGPARGHTGPFDLARGAGESGRYQSLRESGLRRRPATSVEPAATSVVPPAASVEPPAAPAAAISRDRISWSSLARLTLPVEIQLPRLGIPSLGTFGRVEVAVVVFVTSGALTALGLSWVGHVTRSARSKGTPAAAVAATATPEPSAAARAQAAAGPGAARSPIPLGRVLTVEPASSPGAARSPLDAALTVEPVTAASAAGIEPERRGGSRLRSHRGSGPSRASRREVEPGTEARELALSDLASTADRGEESAGGTGLDLRMLKERPPRAIDTQNPYSQ